MTLGQKIKKLRMEKNLTQKELADQVYVTFQTVSKWEKDENEPDVATLRELSKLFDCSLDYLLKEDEDDRTKEEAKVENNTVTPTEVVTKTIIIHQKEKHVCARCKKDIEDENDLEIDHVCVRPYSRSHPAEYRDDYYHKDCLAALNKEREEARRRVKKAAASKRKKMSFGWGIAGGAVALISSLLIFLLVPACKETINTLVAIILSVVISYAVFATLYCIIVDSYITEVFMDVAGWSIKMPGVIFSWDIEGIVWAIAMKIFLAILGFMLGLFVIGFALALAAILAVVSFPFILIHNINIGYIK